MQRKHHDELEALVSSLESPPDIICLSETWLHEYEDKHSYKIKGYHEVISKPRASTGGAVMVKLKEIVTLIEELPAELEESLAILVRINQDIFLIMLVYNPPNSDKFYFLEQFEHVLDKISAKNDRVIICGDFNIGILKTNNLSSKYIDSIEGNGFDQVIKQPTRIGNTCDTLLDHIIMKDVDVKNAYTLEDQTFSDHLPIILELITTTSHMQSSNSYRDTTFLKSKTQIENFNFALMHELQKIKWFENTSSVNDLFEDFQSRYDLMLNKYAPLRIPKTKKRNVDCPWMCNHIKT